MCSSDLSIPTKPKKEKKKKSKPGSDRYPPPSTTNIKTQKKPSTAHYYYSPNPEKTHTQTGKQPTTAEHPTHTTHHQIADSKLQTKTQTQNPYNPPPYSNPNPKQLAAAANKTQNPQQPEAHNTESTSFQTLREKRSNREREIGEREKREH